jgi:hypothetical protein
LSRGARAFPARCNGEAPGCGRFFDRGVNLVIVSGYHSDADKAADGESSGQDRSGNS